VVSIVSRWREVIDLVSVTDGVNEKGFPEDVEVTRENIFANKKSAGSGEFYRAAQAGFTVDKVFEIRLADYEQEKVLVFEGERYEVLRTYEKGENIELVCLRRDDNHGS
jgi:hypothetical protein